jgi:hypothetical protein
MVNKKLMEINWYSRRMQIRLGGPFLLEENFIDFGPKKG